MDSVGTPARAEGCETGKEALPLNMLSSPAANEIGGAAAAQPKNSIVDASASSDLRATNERVTWSRSRRRPWLWLGLTLDSSRMWH